MMHIYINTKKTLVIGVDVTWIVILLVRFPLGGTRSLRLTVRSTRRLLRFAG